MKSLLALLAVAPTLSLLSCSNSGGDPNYDTTDPYGIPGHQAAAAPASAADGAETGTYQPIGGNTATAAAPTSSSNPTYAPAVYEDHTDDAPATTAVKRAATSTNAARPANHVLADEAPARRGGTIHTVVKGDSLWSIGKKYGVSVNSLKAANNLTKDTVILGQKIRVPN